MQESRPAVQPRLGLIEHQQTMKEGAQSATTLGLIDRSPKLGLISHSDDQEMQDSSFQEAKSLEVQTR